MVDCHTIWSFYPRIIINEWNGNLLNLKTTAVTTSFFLQFHTEIKFLSFDFNSFMIVDDVARLKNYK